MREAWRITWVRSAEKYFLRLAAKRKERIKIAIGSILQNPFTGPNIKKLHGELEGLYRYQVGSLRMIYRVLSREKTIRIIAFGTRGDVYK